jgi:hypothetical protein
MPNQIVEVSSQSNEMYYAIVLEIQAEDHDERVRVHNVSKYQALRAGVPRF